MNEEACELGLCTVAAEVQRDWRDGGRGLENLSWFFWHITGSWDLQCCSLPGVCAVLTVLPNKGSVEPADNNMNNKPFKTIHFKMNLNSKRESGCILDVSCGKKNRVFIIIYYYYLC